MATKQKKKKPGGATRQKIVEPKQYKLPFRVLPLLKAAGLVVFLGAFFQGGRALLLELDRPIANVQIAGQLKHVDRKEVQKWVGTNVEEGTLTVDLEDLQAHIQKHPWVNRVSVRRQWPGTLQVSIVEHIPVARWNKKGLLTGESKTFEVSEKIAELDIPHLYGPKGSAVEVWEKYLWVNEVLNDLGLSVAKLTKEERGAWRLRLRENPVSHIYLGREELEERLVRFKVLYRKVLSERFNEVVRIDLRYTNGAAIKWKTKKTVG